MNLHGIDVHPGERVTELLGGPARRRVVVLLACVLGLSTADASTIGALAAPLERAFHVDNTEIGLLVTVSTLVGALATLPFGVLADRVRRTRMLQIATAVWGAAALLSAFSVSYVMLILTRVALGGVIAVGGPTVASLVGDFFPAADRGRMYGFVLTGELVGAGAGILLAGNISGFLNWRPAIGVLAIPAFFLAYALHAYLPEPARGGQSQLAVGDEEISSAEDVSAHPERYAKPAGSQVGARPSLMQRRAKERGYKADRDAVIDRPPSEMNIWQACRYVLRVRTNLALIVASALGYFFLEGLQTFAELFLRARYGLGQSLASTLFVVVAAGAVVGVLVSGRSADRLIRRGRVNARIVVGAIAYLATVVLFAPAMLIGVAAVSLPLLVLGAAALGAVNPPVDAARLDVMPSGIWGRAESVRTALRTLLEAFSPLTFGAVSGAFGASSVAGFGAGVRSSSSGISPSVGHSLGYTFLLLSTPLIFASVVLWRNRKRYGRDIMAAARSEKVIAEAGAHGGDGARDGGDGAGAGGARDGGGRDGGAGGYARARRQDTAGGEGEAEQVQEVAGDAGNGAVPRSETSEHEEGEGEALEEGEGAGG